MTLTSLLVTLLVFDGQARTIALVIVGAILLLILLNAFFPGVGSFQVWK